MCVCVCACGHACCCQKPEARAEPQMDGWTEAPTTQHVSVCVFLSLQLRNKKKHHLPNSLVSLLLLQTPDCLLVCVCVCMHTCAPLILILIPARSGNFFFFLPFSIILASLMLPPPSAGAPAGLGLINDLGGRLRTKTRDELTGRERDRRAVFYSRQRWTNTCFVLFFCGGAEAIFQLKRHLVYVLTGVSERKKKQKNKNGGKHTNGRDSSSLRHNPSFPEVGVHWRAFAVFTTSSKVRERPVAAVRDGRLRPLPPSSPIRWARRGLARRDACVDGCRWPVMRGRRGWIQSLALMAAAPFIYAMIDGGFPNERRPGIMSLRPLRRGRGGKNPAAAVTLPVERVYIWRLGTSERLFVC